MRKNENITSGVLSCCYLNKFHWIYTIQLSIFPCRQNAIPTNLQYKTGEAAIHPLTDKSLEDQRELSYALTVC